VARRPGVYPLDRPAYDPRLTQVGASQMLPALSDRDFGYRGPSPRQPMDTGSASSCCGGRRPVAGLRRSWLDRNDLPAPNWPQWHTLEGDGDKDWDPKEKEPSGGKGKQQKPPWEKADEHPEQHLQILYRDVTPNCDITPPEMMNFRTGYWYGEAIPGGVIVHSISYFQFMSVARPRIHFGAYYRTSSEEALSAGSTWSPGGEWQESFVPNHFYNLELDVESPELGGILLSVRPTQRPIEREAEDHLVFSAWIETGG